MDASTVRFESVQEYIEAFPPEIRERLQTVRAIVQEVAPEATETISYGMPTYKEGVTLVHFAAFKNHIGLYGASGAAEAFKDELGEKKTTKGSIQFLSSRPLPVELIRKIVQFRVLEARELKASRQRDRPTKQARD
jgi:uncharacterized protein YdhG (YjbR/CyaY superfamily)